MTEVKVGGIEPQLSNLQQEDSFIKLPWTDSDTTNYLAVSKLVERVKSATGIGGKKTEYSADEVAGFSHEFATLQPVIRKAFAKWAGNEERSLYSQRPYHDVTEYVKAASRLYEDDPKLDEKLAPGVELIGDYVDDLGKMVETDKHEEGYGHYSALEGLKALSTYVGYGKDQQKKAKASDYLGSNLDLVAYSDNHQGVMSRDGFVQALQVSADAEGQIQQRAQQMVVDTLLSVLGHHYMKMFVPSSYDYSVLLRNLDPQLMNIVRSEVDKYGLNTDRIMAPWEMKEGLTKQQIQRVWDRRANHHSVVDTLKNLKSLEDTYPGEYSARILQEMFGINHFGRYPVELLARQFAEREDLSKPYGVILGAADDYSEVTENHKEAYKMLFAQLGDEMSIRITECDGKYGPQGIGRRFQEFRNRYNPNNAGHKISFLIIAGHGDVGGDLVWFGLNKKFGKFTADDLDDPRIQGIKDDFVDHPDIIVGACQSGIVLAQALSRMLGGTSYAHTGDINRIETIRVVRENARPRLIPEITGYKGGNTVKFVKGEPIVA